MTPSATLGARAVRKRLTLTPSSYQPLFWSLSSTVRRGSEFFGRASFSDETPPSAGLFRPNSFRLGFCWRGRGLGWELEPPWFLWGCVSCRRLDRVLTFSCGFEVPLFGSIHGRAPTQRLLNVGFILLCLLLLLHLLPRLLASAAAAATAPPPLLILLLLLLLPLLPRLLASAAAIAAAATTTTSSSSFSSSSSCTGPRNGVPIRHHGPTRHHTISRSPELQAGNRTRVSIGKPASSLSANNIDDLELRDEALVRHKRANTVSVSDLSNPLRLPGTRQVRRPQNERGENYWKFLFQRGGGLAA